MRARDTETGGVAAGSPLASSTRTAIVLVAVLLVFSLARTWRYAATSAVGIDFYQFWVVAQTAGVAPVTEIYSDFGRARIGALFYERALARASSDRERAAADYRRVLETYSSPFLYSLFRLFPSGSYETAFGGYVLVCLIAGSGGILALCRAFRYPLLAALLAVAVFMEWFEPLLSDLRVGNVNQLQLGLVGLYLWLQSRSDLPSRHLIGGALLGLAVVFKPNLAFVVALLSVSWLVNGRFRKLGEQWLGMGVAAATAFAVSSLSFGSARIWWLWLGSLARVPDAITTIPLGNYALARLVEDLAGLRTGVYVWTMLIAATTVSLWLRRRAGRASLPAVAADGGNALQEDGLMVALGCLTYLLAARLVWLHYLVLAIPAVLFLLRPRERVGRQPSWAAVSLPAAATVLIGVNPLAPIFAGSLGSVLAVNVGLLLLFGLAISDVWRADGRRQPDGSAEPAARDALPATS